MLALRFSPHGHSLPATDTVAAVFYRRLKTLWQGGRNVEDGRCGGMAGWDEVLHRAAAPAVRLGGIFAVSGEL